MISLIRVRYYLTWKDMRFGSDSIIVELRYKKYRHIIDQVMKNLPDYKAFYEDLIRKSYTIGGMIIFPKHTGSMNQNRGTNNLISDRWARTLIMQSPQTPKERRIRERFHFLVNNSGNISLVINRQASVHAAWRFFTCLTYIGYIIIIKSCVLAHITVERNCS